MKKTMDPKSLANLNSKNGVRYSYATLAKMTHRMMMRRFTINGLAKASKVSWSSAHRWTTEMHRAKCVHIVEYLKSPNGKHTERVWQWGAEDDAQKPVKLSRKEYFAECKQKRYTTLEGAFKRIAALERDP